MITEVVLLAFSSSILGYLMYYQRGLEGVKAEFNVDLPTVIKLMLFENLVFAWIIVIIAGVGIIEQIRR